MTLPFQKESRTSLSTWGIISSATLSSTKKSLFLRKEMKFTSWETHWYRNKTSSLKLHKKYSKYSSQLLGLLIAQDFQSFPSNLMAHMSVIQDGDVWLEWDKCYLLKLLRNTVRFYQGKKQINLICLICSMMLIKSHHFPFKTFQKRHGFFTKYNLDNGTIHPRSLTF